MNGPAFLPRQVVRLAAHVLPTGSTRDRYQREFVAEMYAMPAKRQRTYALGVLSHAWSLRAALADDSLVIEEMKMQHKPLMCRLHLHHVWQWASADDGSRYQHCGKCGKERADYPEEGGQNLINRGIPMG